MLPEMSLSTQSSARMIPCLPLSCTTLFWIFRLCDPVCGSMPYSTLSCTLLFVIDRPPTSNEYTPKYRWERSLSATCPPLPSVRHDSP